MRWLAIVVAVLGLALVGAGCGGGDDEAAGDDTTIVTETTDTDATETTDDTDTDTDASGIGNLTEDCLAAVGAYATLSQAVASAFSGAAAGAEESAELFEEFADKAPDEIEDDIRVIAEAYAAFVQELGDLNLQEGEAPSADQIQQLTQASEKLNTPEIQAASENFNTWATTNCPG
jgi:hypothetical protein